MQLDLSLHDGQLEVFKSRARYKVVAAGRRWGKTRFAVIELLTKALADHKYIGKRKVNLKDLEAWYIAPTYDQARDIVWQMLKNMAGDIITKTWENDGKLLLANGRCIQIKGSDRPDRLRGVGLSHVVLDEFASMKPETWHTIIRPTLADVSGSATFIGTPLAKNHFYDIYTTACMDLSKEWRGWHFESKDNPFLPKAEVEAARAVMPREVFKQEFEASFQAAGQLIFKHDVQVIDEAPKEGHTFMAVDPAGFYTEGQAKHRNARLDETAIAVVKVSTHGWTILDIVSGRWDVRETSVRILRLCQQHKPIRVGIEKGMQRMAMQPYLEDQARRLNVFPNIVEVTHGGKDKSSRIAWALQGRLEHGRVYAVDGDYLPKLREQLFDFPNGRHDDCIDALAYIDQVSEVVYLEEWIQDQWEPLDEAVGI